MAASLPHRTRPLNMASDLPRRDFASDDDRKLAEKLCNLQAPSSVRLSPDGQRVVYSTTLVEHHATGKHPKSTLWMAKTGQKNSACQLTQGLFDDVHPRWSPDGTSIAFISDRGKEGESSALYILPMMGEPYSITDAEFASDIDAFEFSPDGKSILFWSEDEKSEERKKEEEDETDGPIVWNERWDYARLRVVDVSSKTTKCLTQDLARHLSGATWSPDGKSIAFTHESNTEMEDAYVNGSTVSTISVETGEITDLATIHNYVEDLKWGDDDVLYFYSSTPIHRSCGGCAVYTIDLQDKEVKKHSHGVDSDVEGLMKRSGEIVVKIGRGIKTEVRLLLSNKLLYNDTAGFDIWDIHIDEDDVTFAVPLSYPSHPAEIFTIEGASEPVKHSNLGAPVADIEFGNWKHFNCDSTDKEVKLDGIFVSPIKPAATGPQPTVVMIHGGPTSRQWPEFEGYYFHWASYVLAKGYSVLFPQYRGSTGQGEKFAMYSFGGIGNYDHADVVEITDHAIKSGLVDPKKVMVGGWSQGGFLTYLSCTRNGLQGLDWRFQAGIAGAGITDVDATVLSDDCGMVSDPDLMGGRVQWTMDQFDARNRSASALWEVKSAVDKAKETGNIVIPPMLLLHGDSDERCPSSQTLGFHRALRYHGLPHEYVRYPRQDHGFKEQRFYIDMLMRLGNWCDKYIGPGDGTQGL